MSKKNPEEEAISAAVLRGFRKIGDQRTMEILATWLMAFQRQTNPNGTTEFENDRGCKVLVFSTAPADQDCDCKFSDPWRCAKHQNLPGQIACTCKCHKTVEACNGCEESH
ncbi:MAG: hypothetical protein M0T70_02825 [Geobacteraceae bacterium]|nr:hypothetical protein [Geobacteraceae bacterium]